LVAPKSFRPLVAARRQGPDNERKGFFALPRRSLRAKARAKNTLPGLHSSRRHVRHRVRHSFSDGGSLGGGGSRAKVDAFTRDIRDIRDVRG